jgi:hypothetical protein
MSEPRHCGDCVHYRPIINRDTGRVLPSKGGMCAWKAKVIWPMSVLRDSAWGIDKEPIIPKCDVRRWTKADACKCWENNFKK